METLKKNREVRNNRGNQRHSELSNYRQEFATKGVRGTSGDVYRSDNGTRETISERDAKDRETSEK